MVHMSFETSVLYSLASKQVYGLIEVFDFAFAFVGLQDVGDTSRGLLHETDRWLTLNTAFFAGCSCVARSRILFFLRI